jgi:hypothetical protein
MQTTNELINDAIHQQESDTLSNVQNYFTAYNDVVKIAFCRGVLYELISMLEKFDFTLKTGHHNYKNKWFICWQSYYPNGVFMNDYSFELRLKLLGKKFFFVKFKEVMRESPCGSKMLFGQKIEFESEFERFQKELLEKICWNLFRIPKTKIQ